MKSLLSLRSISRNLFLFCILFSPILTKAQISGTVFRDFNANGVKDNSSTFNEPFVSGVTVKAYDASNAQVGGTQTTDANGAFSFSGLTLPVRIEFSSFQSGDYSAPIGSGNNSSVQFYSSATSTANFGVNYPANYCNSTDPNLIVPCYVAGDPLGGGSAGDAGVIVSLPYSSTGQTPTASYLATGKQIGSVYGQALLRSTKNLFSAAFVKRHVGLGPNGAGAIYAINLNTNSIKLFTTLSAGTVPDAATRNLPASAPAAAYDVAVYDLVGKTGLGEIEISDDEKTLYVVNLGDQKLYSIAINTPSDPTAGAITSVAIPNPCSGGSYRPFALKYYRGKVYVGVVCTNEGSTDPTGMQAVVYEFDGSNFTNVISFPLTYTKGATNDDAAELKKWYPWSNDFYAAPYGLNNNGSNPSFPQPWLTGIDFDSDGSMIVALRDRYGDQGGWNNYGTNLADGNTYPVISNGDILKAGKCSTANAWTIESGGAICGGTATATGTNGEGIGGGEFYDDNVFCCHNESSMGSLALLSGTGEVTNTSLDPLDFDSGGFRFFNNADGTQNRNTGGNKSGVQIYSDADVLTFGKANGLGSIDFNCDPQPIEIGNRVWTDSNNNGVQDAGEAGIDGVTVELYDNSNTKVGTTSTANGGQYYFNTSNVTNGLLPNTAYKIKIASSQFNIIGVSGTPLASLSLTKSNASSAGVAGLADNDAKLVGGLACISVTTGSYGQNDHSLDFGFISCTPPTLTSIKSDTATCTKGLANSNAKITVSGITNGVTYVYGTNGTTGLFALNALTISSGTIALTGLSNPASAITYAFRIYSSDTTCYKDTSVVLNSSKCQCAITAVASGTNVSCNGGKNGTATVTTSNNSGIVTYLWSTNAGSATTQSISGLAAGIYTVTVSDASLCTVVKSYSVTEPIVITPTCTATNTTTIGGNDGTVSVSATGGSGTYTIYSWGGPNAFTSNIQNPTGLKSGSYTVTVTDSKGCTATCTSKVSEPLCPYPNCFTATVKGN